MVIRLSIVDVIPQGLNNAVPQKALANRLNCSMRDVRHRIEDARRHGAPICSSCDGSGGGYYMPLSRREAELYIRMQRHRIRSARRALDAVVRALPNLPDGEG